MRKAEHAVRPYPARRRRVRWAAVAVLVVATAGCAGTGSGVTPGAAPGADQAAPGPAPVLLRSTDLLLPLDGYQLSMADSARLAVATRLLVRQCMLALGLDYVPRQPPPVPGPATWNERRYGLADPAQAARGYWPDGRAAAALGRTPTDATAQEGAALTGRIGSVNGHPVPAGGCGAQVQRELNAGDPPGADKYLAQRLSTDSYFGSRGDPPVRAATAAWSACMAAAGHHYAGPLDPPQDPRFQGAAASALEIATAQADVACKRRTNLVGIWFAAETARQRAAVAANLPALELARTAFRAEVAAAAAAGA